MITHSRKFAESILDRDDMDLSEIEAKLKRLGWTKRQAAQELHVRPETITRYERTRPYWLFRLLDLEWEVRCLKARLSGPEGLADLL